MNSQFRLTLRIGSDNIALYAGESLNEQATATESYPLNKSISAAANLREAFSTMELLQSGYQRGLLQHTTPVMLVPVDEFMNLNGDMPAGQVSADTETLYRHTFTLRNGYQLMSNVLSPLHAVAVYAVNKDLCMVVRDHFSDIRHQPVMEPVWLRYYDRAFSGHRQKLFAYFHDHQLDVFSFAPNRFRYSNSFNADNTHDATYYLLYAWSQLGMSGDNDELHLIGTVPDSDALKKQLHRYIARIY